MRIKKAVLLVLNNKTKGSVLSTEGVHGVLTPVKTKGQILSDNEIIYNLNPLFEDIATSTEQFTTILLYNRSIVGDTFDEIDVVNINITKPIKDIVTFSDSIVSTKGKGLVDSNQAIERFVTSLTKRLSDESINTERFTISLTKNNADTNAITETLSRVVSKVLAEVKTSGDFVAVTASKGIADSVTSSEQTRITTGKKLQEITGLIESTIFNFAKTLQDTNSLVDSPAKSLSKPVAEGATSSDTSSLSPTKFAQDLFYLTDLTIKQIIKGLTDVASLIENIVFNVQKIGRAHV